MLDRGFRSDMQSLPIDCYFCQWSSILKNYQVTFRTSILFLNMLCFFFQKEHLDQSHPNPKCEYCDKQFTSVNKLNEHKVLECQSLTIDCILKDYGCNEQVYLFFN